MDIFEPNTLRNKFHWTDWWFPFQNFEGFCLQALELGNLKLPIKENLTFTFKIIFPMFASVPSCYSDYLNSQFLSFMSDFLKYIMVKLCFANAV